MISLKIGSGIVKNLIIYSKGKRETENITKQ